MHIQPHICIDNYGTAVYRCRYTLHLVWAQAAKLIGATMPGVKCRYVTEDTPEAIALHKQQSIDFHESEGNCNTCKSLGRVASPKCRHGWLDGKCNNDGEPIRFHPDQPLHMPCYESRW